MSIFDAILTGCDIVKEIAKDAASSTFDYVTDKALDATDNFEKNANKKLDKLGNNIEAVLGIGDYQNSSLKNRLFGIFSTQTQSNRKKIEYGDIIGVNRGSYQHYAVYIGNDRVIHYSSANSDLGESNVIREDNISKFLRGEKEYFVFDCEANEKHKLKINTGALCLSANLYYSRKFLDMIMEDKLIVIYSPEETVQRAKSRLGENSYNLVTNNCEHFAIWCKTGVSKSTQVDNILKFLVKVTIPVIRI